MLIPDVAISYQKPGKMPDIAPARELEAHTQANCNHTTPARR